MTRRTLIVLTVISFVLLAFTSPQSAQERQVGNRTGTGDRTQGDRRILDPTSAEKLRSDLVTAYAESDALIKFLAGYEFLRQSPTMKDYETVAQELANERLRVEQLSINDVMLEASYWPDAESVNRIIELARSVRTDTKFQEAIKKAERFYQASSQSGSSLSAKRLNSRGVIAAPAYIAPICNFDDPSNYPSGNDLAISNGIAIALHTLADVLPDLLGFLIGVPDFVKIALVIAAGVVDEVTNALDAVASDAGYCEGVRLYIEDKLANEGGITAILMTDDFYFAYTLKTVRSSLTKAMSNGVPVNCGSTRLAEAAVFFDGSDNFTGTGLQRVIAYKKLRAAFLNIGAAVCIQ